MANNNKSASGHSGHGSAPESRQTTGDKEKIESVKNAAGKQSPASSGTTPLGGDSSTSNDKPGPGGVEGTGGTN